jgi:hypothetical protein
MADLTRMAVNSLSSLVCLIVTLQAIVRKEIPMCEGMFPNGSLLNELFIAKLAQIVASVCVLVAFMLLTRPGRCVPLWTISAQKVPDICPENFVCDDSGKFWNTSKGRILPNRISYNFKN